MAVINIDSESVTVSLFCLMLSAKLKNETKGIFSGFTVKGLSIYGGDLMSRGRGLAFYIQ